MGSIRFAVNFNENVINRNDTKESVKKEIALWFK